ncbi:membrane dipeptidase [Oscillibacter sp. PC13]|uniref:dipeptidase n=1 Tax=Oscillibacter sp. PC13 TaxID=1855299 RepID=UPI0008ECC401|nr:membrane dipeptidase [Oscillibacter sp. PC13]SFP25435.1 membrane dipeptidase [Oscillibacter sp. PC13]
MEFKMKPAYHGYRAYAYLEEGKDYPKFDWADWDWAGRHVLDLTDEEEARVAEILANTPYISLHDHPTLFPRKMDSADDITDAMRNGREMTAYEALAYSNLDCVFDNQLDGVNIISSPGGWKWIDIIHDLGMRLCDIAHQDFLVHCKTVDDIFAAKKAGKIAWVAVVEGAAPIENEVDRIDILYGLGIRQLGVTYSESNALGSGCKENHDGGLTKFGEKCVERMNQVGMLIDVSHCAPQTAYDAVMHSKKPIIASHVGAKGVWPTKRMASDELIKAVAEKGGVIGIEAAPHTTMSKTNMTHDIDSFMEHFEYVKNMVGIDHVGFGVDCLYGDHVGVHHAFSAALSLASTAKTGVAPYEEVPFVKYLENTTESSWNIPRWLVKHGYSDEEIAKVLGGNAIRVLREVWA